MARTTRLRLREAKTATKDRGKTLCSAAQREYNWQNYRLWIGEARPLRMSNPVPTLRLSEARPTHEVPSGPAGIAPESERMAGQYPDTHPLWRRTHQTVPGSQLAAPGPPASCLTSQANLRASHCSKLHGQALHGGMRRLHCREQLSRIRTGNKCSYI